MSGLYNVAKLVYSVRSVTLATVTLTTSKSQWFKERLDLVQVNHVLTARLSGAAPGGDTGIQALPSPPWHHHSLGPAQALLEC